MIFIQFHFLLSSDVREWLTDHALRRSCVPAQRYNCSSPGISMLVFPWNENPWASVFRSEIFFSRADWQCAKEHRFFVGLQITGKSQGWDHSRSWNGLRYFQRCRIPASGESLDYSRGRRYIIWTKRGSTGDAYDNWIKSNVYRIRVSPSLCLATE